MAASTDSAGARDCSRQESSPKGTHDLARKGWDAERVRKRPKRIAEVRRRARCSTDERLVRRHIADARHRYKRAKLRQANGGNPYGPVDPPGMAVLEAIAACESGGNPRAVSASGTYRGKYQFDTGTWASVGGSGDPAAAPELEQDYRAAELYRRRGSAPWPVCG